MTAYLEPRQNLPEPMHIFRFTLEQFRIMIQSNVIPEDARVELLDGYLVEQTDMKQAHANRIKRIYDRMNSLFASRAEVFAQSPIELPSDGRPLPDIALFKLGSVTDAHTPQPEDIHLIVEVAESSIHQDRNFKQTLYARDGIQEYWIVNLTNNQLEVYRNPEGERYENSFTVKVGQNASCLAFPDDVVDWS
jgi:Uma2 family endonuclease